MDRNFDKCLKLLLKHEGGWADNPKDPGGATMKGVTLKTFRALVKKDATKDDLRRITDAQLAVIYRREYWDKVLGAELPSGVDHAVFDFAVNSGPRRAIEHLQSAVGARVDGRIGPATLAATRALPAPKVIDAILASREAFMRRARHPKTKALLWPTFGKGWTARLKRIRAEATELAKAEVVKDPVVVPATTTEGDQAVVILPKDAGAPPPAAPVPQVPVTRNGWAALIAIIGTAGAALYQYFFGG